MFLRINFKDNDFGTEVRDTCENIMKTISNGSQGKDALKRYEEYKNKHGIENIRKAIVLGSYGQLISIKAMRFYDEIKYDFSEQDFYIKYLDKNITLEEVETINANDDNSSTCYIDFYMLQVYLL